MSDLEIRQELARVLPRWEELPKEVKDKVVAKWKNQYSQDLNTVYAELAQ